MDNKILLPFSNIIISGLKDIGDEKWNLLRKLPYYEGWLQGEIFLWISRNESKGYSVKGLDIPAVTDNPIPPRKSWNPDLLILSSLTQTLIWLELKVVSLARPLVNKGSTISQYKGGILKTWRALCGFSLVDTLALWESSKSSQQLINMGVEPNEIISIAKNSNHFGAVLILSTGLKEGPSKLLSSEIEGIHENIEVNLFNKFKEDWIILFGKNLISL